MSAIIFSFALLKISVFSSFLYLLARPMVNGAIYMPTLSAALRKMIDMANIQKGERVADIGSGDGRVVMAFAKKGAEVHGYEINPLLVWESRYLIKKAGFSKNAFVHRKSFWKVDFSSFDVVTVYGIPYIMKRLGEKLRRELKSGTKVISNIYEFPDWKYVEKEKGVYLYIV